MAQYKLIHCNINGKDVEKMVDVRASLTDMLRNDYHLTSVKKGCEVGECGACNVLIDGECFNSCIYLAVWAEGKHIRTLEGLLGPDGELSDIQQAFMEETAVQCGFCTPGFIMTAVEILESGKEYTREDGTKGISYNAKVVYDISETSAKDRQQEPEPKSMRELVSALIDASPVPCVPVGELELPAYYDSSQQTIFVKKGLSEEVLFVSMAKEVSAAVYDYKYNESRDASDFKSFCVAYMVSSRYGVDTRGFDFSRLPREYAEMDTQAFKGELGAMRDVLGEIQSDMYKSMEKNKPAKNKEQER